MSDHPSVAERVTYDSAELLEEALAATPLAQFGRWYAEARTAAAAGRIAEANAMVLATVGPDGRPTARTVLLKGVGAAGFRFYTNLRSRKARAIAGCADVALLFGWHGIDRQVTVLGRAEPLPRAAVTEYFTSRPWASRVGARASEQSAVAGSRAEIDARAADVAARYPDRGRPDDVPLPAHWGGYLVRPHEVEFWQGRPSRLHDRLAFVARGAGAPEAGARGAGAPGAASPELTASLDDPAAWRVERRWP